MKKIRIIVTSAGAGPAIAVIKALKTQKTIPLEIIAMDMDITAAGLYLADDFILAPPINDSNFLNFMIQSCKDKQIDFIIPIFDLETPFFAQNKQILKSEVGVEVLTNDYNVVCLCNNKQQTHDYCLANNIVVPKIFTDNEVRSMNISFPVLLKPNYGVGSKDIRIINNKKELDAILPLKNGFFIQEYIEGTEYTIDTLSDFNGRCLSALPRERTVVKAGQTVKGRTVNDLKLVRYGKQIAEKFQIKGVGCSQCKVKNEKIYFIEMNPRYGTGVSLSIGSGLNIPLLHLKLALNLPISEEELKFKDNYIMTRYWEEIFIDGNKINKNNLFN